MISNQQDNILHANNIIRDKNIAIKRGYASLGIQLFHSNYNLEEFFDDLKEFNDIFNTIFMYFPELRGVISVNDINSYVGSKHWNNDSISPDLKKRLLSLIDRLVSSRYDILNGKYVNFSKFPDKYSLCDIYSNSVYMDTIKDVYDNLERKCSENSDLYYLGQAIACIDNSSDLNSFYSDILKLFVARSFGEKQFSDMIAYINDNHSFELAVLGGNGSLIDKLKDLLPNDNLFHVLYEYGYLSNFDSVYSDYERFGKILYCEYSNYRAMRSKLFSRFKNLRLDASNLKSAEELIVAYNDFVNQFKKIRNINFITFEQFKLLVSKDDSYFNAIFRGYDSAILEEKNDSYYMFGKKLASYAQNEANDKRNANDISMNILFELLDSFKEDLLSQRIQKFNSVLKKYPLLDGTLNFNEFYQMFKPNKSFDIVDFGYQHGKKGFSKLAPASKVHSSK